MNLVLILFCVLNPHSHDITAESELTVCNFSWRIAQQRIFQWIYSDPLSMKLAFGLLLHLSNVTDICLKILRINAVHIDITGTAICATPLGSSVFFFQEVPLQMIQIYVLASSPCFQVHITETCLCKVVIDAAEGAVVQGGSQSV